MEKNKFLNYYIVEDSEGQPAVWSSKLNRTLKTKRTKNGYKMITVRDEDGNKETLLFARFLLMLSQPKEDYTNLEVDHIDRDPLNDRLDNLRLVTKKENSQNRIYGPRPHRGTPIIIWDHSAGDYYEYTYKNKNNFRWSYSTIYTLATAKEGSHYSPKWNITCRYKNLID